MDEYDDIFTLEGDTKEPEQTQNQTPPQPSLGNGRNQEQSNNTPSGEGEDEKDPESPRTPPIVPTLNLRGVITTPEQSPGTGTSRSEGEETDRTDQSETSPPSSPRTITNRDSTASIQNIKGTVEETTAIIPESPAGNANNELSTKIEETTLEETTPNTARSEQTNPEATQQTTARSETDSEATPQATPREPETPRGEPEVPSPTQLSNEAPVAQPAPPTPPANEDKTKETKTTLSWEEQYFQTLGEKTEAKLQGKMSSRGDSKDQEPSKKDRSKTYSRLNVSENTTELEALENRAKVIARSKDDYKPEQNIDREKIELRQKAMTETTKALHQVLTEAPNQVKPEKGNGQFKIGPLSFKMDDNNNIDFPNELDGQQLTFKGSMSFVGADGKAMPQENRVYLGIAYEKGQISHIHTPGGLKEDEQGRAYIEIDNNRYYAKASYAKIQELEKAVDERREAKITELKAEKAEKVPEEQQTVEYQSTNTKPLSGPSFNPAPYPPIAPRPPSKIETPPLGKGTGKFWEMVEAAKTSEQITALENYINNTKNAEEVNSGIDELNEEQAEALLRKLDQHLNTNKEADATAEDIGTMLDRLNAMSDANKAGFKSTIASLQKKVSRAEREVAGPKEEELSKEELNEDLLAAAGRYNGSDEQKNEILDLIKEGADVNTKEQDQDQIHGMTPLMYVAASGNDIQFLLEQGADVNAVNENGGDTALTIATKLTNNAQNVNLLIDQGANVNHQNESGKTALMYAAQQGSFAMVKDIADNQDQKTNQDQNNINAQDKDGNTALMYAAQKGNNKVVGRLLNVTGIDLTIKNNDGKTALDIAREAGQNQIPQVLPGTPRIIDHSEVVKLLEEEAKPRRKINAEDISKIVAKPDIDKAQRMPNAPQTPAEELIAASKAYINEEGQQAYILDLIKEKNADINTQDPATGRTPLMILASNGADVDFLVQNGANLNTQDKNGNTALIHAIEQNNVQAVTTLLNAGADIRIENNNKHEAWSIAANLQTENSKAAIINALTTHQLKNAEKEHAAQHRRKNSQNGPETPIDDKNKDTSQLSRIREGLSSMTGFFIGKKKKKADVPHSPPEETTPTVSDFLQPPPKLSDAQKEYKNNAKVLQPLKPTQKEKTKAFGVQGNGQREEMDWLHQVQNAEANTKELNNQALINAVKSGNTSEVNRLLDQKADPNYKDSKNNGNTALHTAVERENVEIVKALLKKEADPNKLNDNNKTAFNIAVERWNDASEQSNDTKIVELLCANENITAGTIDEAIGNLPIPNSSDTNEQESYSKKFDILRNEIVRKNNPGVVSPDLLKDRLSENSQTTTHAQRTDEISPVPTPPRKTTGTSSHELGGG